MAATADYTAYYQSQVGGQLRVFRGGLQSGAGLGDVLRGLFRFLAPIAIRGLSAFATNALSGHMAGLPLALAAKGAIMPTISAIAGTAAPSITRLAAGFLPGLVNRFAPSQPSQPTQPSILDSSLGYDGDDVRGKQKGSGVLFDGVDGIPVESNAIKQYKKDAAFESADKPSKRTKKSRKRAQQGNTIHYNF